jgi:hypothetical protein
MGSGSEKNSFGSTILLVNANLTRYDHHVCIFLFGEAVPSRYANGEIEPVFVGVRVVVSNYCRSVCNAHCAYTVHRSEM